MNVQAIRPIELAVLEQQIADLLASYPEIAEDDQLRADMLEGSTDIAKLIGVMLDAERDGKAMQAAISERVAALRTRADRYERRCEGARKMILRLMEVAGLKRLALPEGTISVANVPPGLVVVDEAAVPAEFWREKVERRIDRTALKDALKGGTTIAGAYLSNGGSSVRIL